MSLQNLLDKYLNNINIVPQEYSQGWIDLLNEDQKEVVHLDISNKKHIKLLKSPFYNKFDDRSKKAFSCFLEIEDRSYERIFTKEEMADYFFKIKKFIYQEINSYKKNDHFIFIKNENFFDRYCEIFKNNNKDYNPTIIIPFKLSNPEFFKLCKSNLYNIVVYDFLNDIDFIGTSSSEKNSKIVMNPEEESQFLISALTTSYIKKDMSNSENKDRTIYQINNKYFLIKDKFQINVLIKYLEKYNINLLSSKSFRESLKVFSFQDVFTHEAVHSRDFTSFCQKIYAKGFYHPQYYMNYSNYFQKKNKKLKFRYALKMFNEELFSYIEDFLSFNKEDVRFLKEHLPKFKNKKIVQFIKKSISSHANLIKDLDINDIKEFCEKDFINFKDIPFDKITSFSDLNLVIKFLSNEQINLSFEYLGKPFYSYTDSYEEGLNIIKNHEISEENLSVFIKSDIFLENMKRDLKYIKLKDFRTFAFFLCSNKRYDLLTFLINEKIFDNSFIKLLFHKMLKHKNTNELKGFYQQNKHLIKDEGIINYFEKNLDF